MIRAPHLKKNLYVQEVQTESIDAYKQGRMNLEELGYTIKAIVLDGKHGVRQLFSDITIQMCHFHQKQIIARYLTNNPKLEAGIELKKITDTFFKPMKEILQTLLITGIRSGLLFSKRKQ